MVRRTRIKVDSIDLPKVFAPGYVMRQGLVVTGTKWIQEKFIFSQPVQNQTEFQLSRTIPLDLDGNLTADLLRMFVNGVDIDIENLSIHPAASNTLVYNPTNTFQIDSDDHVVFWIAEYYS